MGKKPDLNNLKIFFESGKDFELTDSQYEKKTGAVLPKNKYYILKNSALAKEAKKHGYYLELIEKTIIVKKLMEE